MTTTSLGALTRAARGGAILAALLTAAACAPAVVTQTTTTPAPYVDTADGGARYIGDATAATQQGVLPGSATPQAFAATAGDSVTFPENQVALTTEAQAVVSQQAAWLLRNRDFHATIEGHADEQGTREYNLALGARRAASVQEYLIARGVEPGRVSTLSYGNERPLAVCETADCLNRNRRAVTVVTAGAAGV